jgi:hypothetical protein
MMGTETQKQRDMGKTHTVYFHFSAKISHFQLMTVRDRPQVTGI